MIQIKSVILCTVGNCAALAIASLEMGRADPFTSTGDENEFLKFANPLYL